MKDENGQEQPRIVKLAPLHVVSVLGFGEQPEHLAWEKLKGWAGSRGYLNDPAHRIFGFNNPNPSAGSPNYGYEFWIEVVPDEAIGDGDDGRCVEFTGGDYAVSRVEVIGDAYEAIPAAWQRLHRWCEEQGLRFGSHQWLEEHLSAPGAEEGFTLDLYLPIVT